jgi:hypothetical protein
MIKKRKFRAATQHGIDGMLLLRLEDCATSSRLGLADKGFPRAMSELKAKGLVEEVQGGHKITVAGRTFLAEHEAAQRRQRELARQWEKQKAAAAAAKV